MSRQTLPSETEIRANRAEDVQALEEDARLRNDIRLLGRILGDTVRDQEGADVFDLVERIRQTSIRFHRDEDRLARRELESILDRHVDLRDGAHRARLQLFLAPSPISQRTRTTSARCGRGPGRAAPARERAGPDAIPCPRRRFQRGRSAKILQGCAGQSGADRAPHGSPPQEYPWTARWRSRRCSTGANGSSSPRKKSSASDEQLRPRGADAVAGPTCCAGPN